MLHPENSLPPLFNIISQHHAIVSSTFSPNTACPLVNAIREAPRPRKVERLAIVIIGNFGCQKKIWLLFLLFTTSNIPISQHSCPQNLSSAFLRIFQVKNP
jgi:hypothetical protein